MLALIGLCVFAWSVVGAQQVFQFQGGAPGGGGFGGTPPTPEAISKMLLDFMSRRLDDQKLSESEKTAAMEALKAKSDSRTKLQEKLTALREVSDDQKATDDDVKKSLNDFVRAQIDYNTAVSSADLALVKKVSLRTRAKLTVLGVVENGVGAGGGGFFGGGGRQRGGGPGGSGGGAGGGARPGATPGGGSNSDLKLDQKLEKFVNGKDLDQKSEKKTKKQAKFSGIE